MQAFGRSINATATENKSAAKHRTIDVNPFETLQIINTMEHGILNNAITHVPYLIALKV